MSLLNYYVLYPGTMRFQEKFLPWLDRIYGQFLTFVMTGKRPLKFILGTIGLLFFSIFLMVIFPPKVEFFPENDPNYVNIFISHPIGTDIKITNETTIEVEKDINKILEKYINKDTEAGIPKNEQIIKSIISRYCCVSVFLSSAFICLVIFSLNNLTFIKFINSSKDISFKDKIC